MPEHQEIEWKESWRDEYLKWICGDANAHGGTLFIGKDDNGKVVGISDSKNMDIIARSGSVNNTIVRRSTGKPKPTITRTDH